MFDASGFIDMTSNEETQRADAALHVRFEWVDVADPEATKANGYPSFTKREMVRILIPGSREERYRRVTREHKLRFPRAYAAFLAGTDEAIDGTPIKECPILTATEVSMFKHHGVHSIEQAAALSDENISNMGHGVRPIRDRVKAWHDARKGQAPFAELNAQLQQKDEQLARLSERLALLEAGAKPEVPEPKKRIRNRKPKTETTPTES